MNVKTSDMKHKMILGAIAGDVIGSVYEFHPVREKDFELFTPYSSFTDDTVMTVANADWLVTGDSLMGIMQEYVLPEQVRVKQRLRNMLRKHLTII